MLNELAWFLVENDRKLPEALELVNNSLKLKPDYMPFLDTKGLVLHKLGRYKEALEALQKVWDLAPIYDDLLHSHLEEAKKAVAKQKM